MSEDIRWQQRFSNYQKVLRKLSVAVEYVASSFKLKSSCLTSQDRIVDKIIREGVIHRFEYTHELAWYVMKDYAAYQGNSLIGGSRDATREAFQLQLISDGSLWMDMISSRNKTSHTYNEHTAGEIFSKIRYDYYPAFISFEKTMNKKLMEDYGDSI